MTLNERKKKGGIVSKTQTQTQTSFFNFSPYFFVILTEHSLFVFY